MARGGMHAAEAGGIESLAIAAGRGRTGARGGASTSINGELDVTDLFPRGLRLSERVNTCPNLGSPPGREVETGNLTPLSCENAPPS